jgi:hypothetical protein
MREVPIAAWAINKFEYVTRLFEKAMLGAKGNSEFLVVLAWWKRWIDYFDCEAPASSSLLCSVALPFPFDRPSSHSGSNDASEVSRGSNHLILSN